MTDISALFLWDLAHKVPAFLRTLSADIMDIYHDTYTVHKKSDNSPFTIADTMAENRIVDFLSHCTPHIPIYAEESFDGTVPECMPESFWLVDPIDGTKGFISRNNYFTINIGLIYQGNPIFGVVYVPLVQDCYVGFAYGDYDICTDIPPYVSTDISPCLSTGFWASYKNGGRIQSPPLDSQNMDTLVVATHADTTKNPMKRFLAPHTVRRVLPYTSSIKICLVAEGACHVYPRYGLCSEWDTCAGDAILRGTGGVLCTFDGVPLAYGKPKLLNTGGFLCVSGAYFVR